MKETLDRFLFSKRDNKEKILCVYNEKLRTEHDCVIFCFQKRCLDESEENKSLIKKSVQACVGKFD